ncbi:MAG: RnfABCDGE type electron transport complex subunit D [Acutalibacteraceae bacterium]|nr:RnfABCDGE type electron transport complex subunit D [Acutalibacteraceae bacterium]
MVNGKKLVVSASPHIRSEKTTTRIMLDVIIALIPALIASFVFFGPKVLAVTATTVITSVLAEYISRKVMKRHNTIGDLSAVVTGLILAFNLPSTVPLWIAAVGSVVAIVVVKQFFGGIGQNFANPAITARIVLLLSFATKMSGSEWAKPLAWITKPEVMTTATPLALYGEENAVLPSLLDMFIGNRAGSLGETCTVALLIGGIYLIARKVISFKIPLAYLGSFALIMLVTGFIIKRDPVEALTYAAYQFMSGGLFLGAFFMATDYATSPINTDGKYIFGVGCGILTALIRIFGSLPEGVSFAILIMNLLVPHIERITTPKPFGTPKKEKKAKEADAK